MNWEQEKITAGEDTQGQSTTESMEKNQIANNTDQSKHRTLQRRMRIKAVIYKISLTKTGNCGKSYLRNFQSR